MPLIFKYPIQVKPKWFSFLFRKQKISDLVFRKNISSLQLSCDKEKYKDILRDKIVEKIASDSEYDQNIGGLLEGFIPKIVAHGSVDNIDFYICISGEEADCRLQNFDVLLINQSGVSFEKATEKSFKEIKDRLKIFNWKRPWFLFQKNHLNTELSFDVDMAIFPPHDGIYDIEIKANLEKKSFDKDNLGVVVFLTFILVVLYLNNDTIASQLVSINNDFELTKLREVLDKINITILISIIIVAIKDIALDWYKSRGQYTIELKSLENSIQKKPPYKELEEALKKDPATLNIPDLSEINTGN